MSSSDGYEADVERETYLRERTPSREPEEKRPRDTSTPRRVNVGTTTAMRQLGRFRRHCVDLDDRSTWKVDGGWMCRLCFSRRPTKSTTKMSRHYAEAHAHVWNPQTNEARMMTLRESRSLERRLERTEDRQPDEIVIPDRRRRQP